MGRLSRLLLCLGLLLLSSCGGYTLPSRDLMQAELENYSLPVSPDNEHGVVYVVRPHSGAKFVSFDVYIDGKGSENLLAENTRLQYVYAFLPVGEHTIYSKAENWAELRVDVQPNQSIFIEQIPKVGVAFARNELRVIDELAGKYFVKRLKVRNFGDVRKRREAQKQKMLQYSIAERTQRYIIQLQDLDPRVRRKAIMEIIRFYPVGEQMYNLIDGQLNEALPPGNSTTSPIVLTDDDISYYCKALAASGMEKYLPTIEKAAASDTLKVRRHCSGALNQYSDYFARRHDVMSQPPFPGADAETSAYIHLLRSGETDMIKEGVESIIFFNQKSEVVLDSAESVLLEFGVGEKYREGYLHSMGKLVKLLGWSRNPKYRKTLEQIEKEATDWQLRSWARGSLEKIQ